MKTFFKAILVASLLIAIFCTCSYCWGFWAHQRINRMAVFSVHPDMFGFFKHHIDYLTTHAVDPDKRRYAMEGEAACHFIDLDRYGDHPLDSIPQRWKDAVEKYTEDTLMAHGIVPWHIEKMMYRLTNAFKEKNFTKVLKYAADLGHYIGDAHVPLHCTQNYNGQLTGQHGIHGFWESRVPELLGEEYDYLTGRCRYIPNPLKEAWRIVADSYQAHDSVLTFEKLLSSKFPADRKYAYEQKGNVTVKVYSREYAIAYDQMLNGMAERRMREAIIMVASFWYTAWVNAGQPVLDYDFEISADSVDVIPPGEPGKWKLKVKGHED
ncbi:MAG: zinc dependent phospholipase C family protein [Bacteroidota bacterium]|nr:zinc dependent phospholipase C family protein [Bacteroidota bacterium]